MRRALPAAALAALALAAPPLGAARVAEHATRLEVGPDGAGRAVTTVVVSGSPGETLAVPVLPGWASLKLGEAPAGLRLDPPDEKATAVTVTLPPGPAAAADAPVRFTLVFDVPEAFAKRRDASPGGKLTMPRDARMLQVAFVNTQPSPIAAFAVLAVLPEGWRFQAIREQLPRLEKTEVEPRVRLGGEGDRQTALLRLADLDQGDSASMRVEAIPGARSPLWAVAGAALSALYLVKFRDLVSKDAGSASTRKEET